MMWRALAVVALYLSALWFASHVPERYLPLPKRSEAARHFLAYSGLTVLVSWAASCFAPPRPTAAQSRWCRCGCVLAVVAVALLDELTQPLTGRNFQWKDVRADLAGIVAAALVLEAIFLLRGTARRKTDPPPS